jgi:hypothetical protein
MISTLFGCVLGVASGLRHAMEPDHLAAVSTVVAEQKTARASMRFAATWGAGHALMLLAVGGALLALRASMPRVVEDSLELGVALMLVVLGGRSLVRAARSAGAAHVHTHSDSRHSHPGARAHVHAFGRALALRPLLIGIVHGTAGSGALTALAISRAPSFASGLLFLALYGAGAALGMAALAGAVGAPLARLASGRRTGPALLAVVGALSLCTGLVWGVAAALRITA